jgi:hypothetical protein
MRSERAIGAGGVSEAGMSFFLYHDPMNTFNRRRNSASRREQAHEGNAKMISRE